MKLDPDSLAAHLQKSLLPAYLVSGDEPLLTGEAADAIRAAARAAGYTEREVHFMDRGASWDDVRASGASLSLFAEKRIVEVRLPSGKAGKEGSEVLAEMIAARLPDTLLLVLSGRLERDAQSAAWVRAAEQHGAWVQVWPVDAQRLVGWLRARCRRLDLQAEGEALELLADRTEGNLLAAQQELEKLRLLAPGGRVTPDAVLASVGDSARFDVYQLGEAALAGDCARALRVLDGLRAEGVEPVLALWAILRDIRALWSAVADPTRKSWLPPKQQAAVEQAKRRAPRLSFARLTARAERADRMMKGRLAGNPWDELALLAAELAGTPALSLPARPMR